MFGDLDVRIEPWEVDYGSELPLAPPADEAKDEVLLDVEAPFSAWRPIAPAPGSVPARMHFVDGVRRIEARLLVRRAGRLLHGAFGGYAVGSVMAADGTAMVNAVRVARAIVVGAGETVPAPIEVGASLTYGPLATSSEEPDGPLRAIHDAMRAAEEDLARELAAEEGALVVADGPLTFQGTGRGAAVGYVKRLHELYLPASGLGVLAALRPRTRTPLFALRSRRFGRYAWFLRLSAPARADSDLAGIVRLEVADVVGLEAARRLADATARALPRFAPTRGPPRTSFRSARSRRGSGARSGTGG